MAARWWHLYVELSVVFSVSGDQCRTGHVVAPLASLFVCPTSIGVPPFATSSQGEEFLHDRCKQEGELSLGLLDLSALFLGYYYCFRYVYTPLAST